MGQIAVLSLDGGGTFAGVLATALGALYGPSTPGGDILRRFDLVAANSGGSIVLSALLANFSPGDVAGFYADPATVREMYSPRRFSALRLAPYSSDGKRAALAKLLDSRCAEGEQPPSSIPLGKWPSILGKPFTLVITAYDYDAERGAFFRSTARAGDVEAERRRDVPIIDAVHASTQAPIRYYGKPAVVAGRRYWDGGLAGYNNPVLAAVIEARREHPARVDDIRVLSIGTGIVMTAPYGADAPRSLARPTSTALFAQLRKVAGAVLADPPCAATFDACVALEGTRASASSDASRLVRLSPLVRPWRDQRLAWQPPRGLSTQEFETLVKMKADTMRGSDLAMIRRVAQLWIDGSVENEPVLIADSPSLEFGDRTFGDARRHWLALLDDRSGTRDGFA